MFFYKRCDKQKPQQGQQFQNHSTSASFLQQYNVKDQDFNSKPIKKTNLLCESKTGFSNTADPRSLPSIYVVDKFDKKSLVVDSHGFLVPMIVNRGDEYKMIYPEIRGIAREGDYIHINVITENIKGIYKINITKEDSEWELCYKTSHLEDINDIKVQNDILYMLTNARIYYVSDETLKDFGSNSGGIAFDVSENGSIVRVKENMTIAKKPSIKAEHVKYFNNEIFVYSFGSTYGISNLNKELSIPERISAIAVNNNDIMIVGESGDIYYDTIEMNGSIKSLNKIHNIPQDSYVSMEVFEDLFYVAVTKRN